MDRLVKKYQVVPESETDDNNNSTQAKRRHRRLRKRRGPVAKVLHMLAAVLLVLLISGVAAVITLNRIGKKSIGSGESVGISNNDYAATYDEAEPSEYNGKNMQLNQNLITKRLMGVDKETLAQTRA